MTTSKNEHLTTLRSFTKRLGLKHMRTYHVENGAIHQFNWPSKNNGTSYDRTLLISDFKDGTWSEYLDTGKVKIDEIESALLRMVRDD